MLELLIAAALTISVFGLVISFMRDGNRLEKQGRLENESSREVRQLLAEMIDGSRIGTADAIPGLRIASEVALAEQGLAFRSAGKVVTYYRIGSSIFRRVEPDGGGSLSVMPSGGVPLLESASAFHADFGPSGILNVSLAVERGGLLPVEGSTSIRPRNR
ncbi:MAG: hypothetical protein HYY09_00080 [Firmicutes bacterium]|nr:hypothetical protein [Bacillota bacterium]